MAEKAAKPTSASTAAAPAAEKPSAAGPKRRTAPSRDKILAVATKLFAARGYAAISIRDIAGECGIGIPSIYHFFGDKDSLYVSCCQKLFGEVEATLCASFHPGATCHDHIRDYTRALCRELLKNNDFRRLSQMEVLQDEHRSIEEITAPHFMSPFKMLIEDIAELLGEKCAKERALLINAIAYGQTQLQRIAQMAGADVHGGDPEKLAELVLKVALPGHDWSR